MTITASELYLLVLLLLAIVMCVKYHGDAKRNAQGANILGQALWDIARGVVTVEVENGNLKLTHKETNK